MEVPVHPSTGDGTQQRDDNHRRARTDLGKQRAGAGTSHRPAEAEEQATEDLTFTKGLGGKSNVVPVDGF